MVLEQAPPDIDQYIQPSDSALLLSSLLSLSVSHFEASQNPAAPQTQGPGPQGDPRSVSITWEFAENEYFEDKKLEKKFWWRRSKDGWSGFVSEPVPIRWKSKQKDLTGGLLDLVVKAWETEQSTSKENGAGGNSKENVGKKVLTPEQKVLKRKIDNTGMGGLSFFAWFGFIGRHISAEESAAATLLEKQRREARQAGKSLEEEDATEERDEEGEDDEGDDLGMSLEIFPDGDDLAVAITEDLWPGAIKYFSTFPPPTLPYLFHLSFPLLFLSRSPSCRRDTYIARFP